MLKDDKEISDLIRKLIPINELTEKIQNELISNANLLEINKGKFLFRKGDKDHFSYYLLSGEINLVNDRQIHDTIKQNTDRALYAMAQLQPRQFSAVAKSTSQVLKVNRTVLDKLLLLSKQSPEAKANLADTISGPGNLEVSEIDEDEGLDWMSRLLQSELFMKIPSGNIQKLFGLLQSETYKAGDDVIEQGQDGENYYVIQEGSCIVTRKAGASSNPIKLAQLRVGDSFGEESLLMDTKCNATVSMETDGHLMRLSKDDFIELIKKPTLQTISFDRAQELVDKVGAVWIDVRFASEHKQSYIEPSKNIPLNLLRNQAKNLSSETQYITYCDTGARSSAAAFLLTERGYKVHYLDGGLISQQEIPNLITNEPAAAPELIKSEESQNEILQQTQINQASKESSPSSVVAAPEPQTETGNESHKPSKSSQSIIEREQQHSAEQELAELKEKYEKQLQKDRQALHEKYADAQKMLDKAKQIRLEAEKSKQKVEAEIEERKSVIELSEKKLSKELQAQVEALESTKEKLEDKNKSLLSKRVELENEIKAQHDEIQALKNSEKDLSEKNAELNMALKTANQEKLKALQDSLKAKQDAKRIIENYKEKHKQLYQMEEELIQQELETLDEESSQFSFDNVMQIDSVSQEDEKDDEKFQKNPSKLGHAK